MRVGVWRRFRPRVTYDNSRHELYQLVQAEIQRAVPHMRRLNWQDDRWLNDAIKRLLAKAEQYPEGERNVAIASTWIALTVLQSPRAARAQVQMDKHHGGYKERKARLFELIDFNDAFVSSVLALPEEYLAEFNQRLFIEMAAFCKKLRVSSFTAEQFEAINHGLSREIAVYRGAIAEGLGASMTSRVQDAKGVDMIITDPHSHRSINIDCKTSSSFHFRLVDRHRQGRMSDQAKLRCETQGYCSTINGKHEFAVDVVLVRIDTELLGKIHNFTFSDTSRLGILLRSALEDHGA